jgi:hypothetical protein
MFTLKLIIALVATLATSAAGHMQLAFPYPLGDQYNPHRTSAPDQELYFPYEKDDSTPFPCRGHLNLVGTPQGASVMTWKQGGFANFSLSGLARGDGMLLTPLIVFDETKFSWKTPSACFY